MAFEKGKTLSDPVPLKEALERIPDSSPVSVSSTTLRESGFAPARTQSRRDTHDGGKRDRTLADGLTSIDSALTEVARTEASLALLVRGLKHVATGASAARDANAELIQELDELRVQLARRDEEEQALRFRMNQVEQMLDTLRLETERERAFLFEQQDVFLAEIIGDHERSVDEFREQLKQAQAQRGSLPMLAELTAQRDQAREYATRCERERDLAWQELATGRAPLGVPAEPAAKTRLDSSTSVANPAPAGTETGQSGPSPLAAIQLRQVGVPLGTGPTSEGSTDRLATGYSLSRKDLEE